MALPDEIIQKCNEVHEQEAFIKKIAAQAKDTQWAVNDPNYTHLKAVYMSARAKIITKVNELPTV